MCTLLEPILSHILHDLKAAFAPGNHLLLVETLSSLGFWNTAFAWFFSSSDSSTGSFSFHPSLSFYIRLHFIGLKSFSFLLFSLYILYSMASQVVKNLPANAEDVRDSGLIPGLGRSLKQEMETYSSILA